MSLAVMMPAVVHDPCSLLTAGVVVPTCNAAGHWPRLQAALTRQGIAPGQILIVDSSSTDGTRDLARRAGYRVLEVSRETFRHGATRQLAAGHLPHADTLIFLTQDAIPCGEDALENLLLAFADRGVGAAYGRQVPHENASLIERHARLFNYPERSEVRDLSSRERIGFRAAFFSNSFAAYRRSAFEEVGGFPRDVIVAEDSTVAARMLLGGWRIAYRADAMVTHSHNFTVRQEFARYFDTGVHHGRSRWLLEQFGTTGDAGRAFVRSQTRFLWVNQPGLLPVAAFRTVAKWFSYTLGMREQWLPRRLKRAISTQPHFWTEGAGPDAEAGDLLQQDRTS